jgi:hypothetical protein
MSPFEFLNSINYTKEDVIVDDMTEKSYNGFMINRSLSYFPDTVQFANVMNQYHHLDNKLQYHFLINIIRKRKRFSKWYIEVIKKYYSYSNEKARQVLSLLSPDQINIIRQKVDQGGRK